MWNVHGFRAGADTVAAAVNEAAPDIALLNEVGWWGRRLRRFRRRTGMRGVWGLRLLRSRLPNAVLVRPPWRVVRFRRVRFARQGRTIPRGMILAVVGQAGVRVAAASVHLGLHQRERADHARELVDRLADIREPVVLGGDLNEAPGGPASSHLAERLQDAFERSGRGPGETFRSDDPTVRIDYLFLSEGCRPEWVAVGTGPTWAAASDHLPVFAEVTVPGVE